MNSLLVVGLMAVCLLLQSCGAPVVLKVMPVGLGSGRVNLDTPGIDCAAFCETSYPSSTPVRLRATADPDSMFAGWEGDCSGQPNPCLVTMDVARSVRAIFNLNPDIPQLRDPIPGTSFTTISDDFTPERIRAYLNTYPQVNSPARFLRALSDEYKENWILMARSESLQTGIAELPRILLPSADARYVFTIGLSVHSSYPGAHPNAIEFMQWDPDQRNFRFHEIVLDAIPAMNEDADPGGLGQIPARSRGIAIDDAKCSKCHSTRNVLNRSPFPGTTGVPIGSVQAKNKPNWDTYDSWGGMMPFNRDRIYQGSVEAAAFRKLFNLWTWRTNDPVRSIIEQLKLQPSGVPAAHVITRTNGGANDGHINFAFDTTAPVFTEPVPSSSGLGAEVPVTINYSFDGLIGTGSGNSVVRGGNFVTLHHPVDPLNDEGRGVRFFDALGGAAGELNEQRIADELIHHRFATGSVPIDVRPITLAITNSCIRINTTTTPVTITPALPATVLGFFDARNGMNIAALLDDTRARAQSLPRRKADIEKITLDRTGDAYFEGTGNGLVQQYGAATSPGLTVSLDRLRQDVFRRPVSPFPQDTTVMNGVYVDREHYTFNTDYNSNLVTLYRYFLEPLGVSVDKWSMGVRGRSRTYTFADVFNGYTQVIQNELSQSLTDPMHRAYRPIPLLTNPADCTQLLLAVDTTFSSLPPADANPTFTDVQRIFNKACIECHGGLDYPPYGNYNGSLDFSEKETPTAAPGAQPNERLVDSYMAAVGYTNSDADPRHSFLFQKICPNAAMLPVGGQCALPSSMDNESCPFGLMPCGGPRLSHADIETIRRWIDGPPMSTPPATVGDPHITTVDGVHYDFQAAGEFVLLRDEGMEIQARQTAVPSETALGPNPYTGLTSCVSINSAAAVRIGRERITFQPNFNSEISAQGLQLRINGKLTELSASGVPLANGGRIIPSTAPGGIQIEAPGGSVVVITPGWWDYYQLWYLNIDTRHMRATQGVMGAIAPGSWLPALPDGSAVGPRPADLRQRYEDLYTQFGNAWRVSDGTSLFDYAPGTSTATFTLETWPHGESPESCLFPLETPGALGKPPLEPLPLEAAQQVCQDLIDEQRRANCVQDVMVTGEPGFAETYLLTEQIERNAVPAVPTLVAPEDTANPGGSVRFTWNRVSDADGDPVTYRHCLWSVSEGPNNNRCEVVELPATERAAGTWYALSIAVVGLLLLVVLIARGMKHRTGLLALVVIATVAGVLLAYRLGGTTGDLATVTKTVSGLESGQIYYWKVFVDDDKGGSVESETRMFQVR